MVDIDDMGNATVLYMDSLSGETDIGKCREDVQLEYTRICDVLKRVNLSVSKSSGVYKKSLQQSDVVSCGPFFMENSSRALRNSKLDDIVPSEVQIRAEQLPNMRAKAAVKSVSVSLEVAAKVSEIASRKNSVDPEDFDELRKSDFKHILKYEYDLSSEHHKGGAEYMRALKALNLVLEKEKAMSRIVEEALKNKFGVNKIEDMVTAKWLERMVAIEPSAKEGLSIPQLKEIESEQRRQFLSDNKGLIKTDVMRTTLRVIDVAKKHDKEYYEGLRESLSPEVGIGSALMTGIGSALAAIVKLVVFKPVEFIFKDIPRAVAKLFLSEETKDTTHELHYQNKMIVKADALHDSRDKASRREVRHKHEKSAKHNASEKRKKVDKKD